MHFSNLDFKKSNFLSKIVYSFFGLLPATCIKIINFNFYRPNKDFRSKLIKTIFLLNKIAEILFIPFPCVGTKKHSIIGIKVHSNEKKKPLFTF